MQGAAGFGFLLALLLWFLLRDPEWLIKRRRQHRHGIWRSLIAVLRDRQMWLIAVVAASSSAPALAFGGLWSLSYLTEVQHLGRADAALINSLLLGGWALGGSGLGWISDRLSRRKGPLLGMLAFGFVVWLAMPFLPPVSAWFLGPLYVLLGISGGSLMAAFALSQELAPPRAGNTASGVVNTLNIGIAAGLQPLFGWMLDSGWHGRMAQGIRLYGATAFGHAMLLFPVFAAIGFLAALGIRETFCRRLHDI
jgi:MFS family permease